MTRRLKEKFLVKKVYASARANSEDKIRDRDHEEDPAVEVEELEGVKETCRDLINRLDCDRQLTRLVVLDYCGLSTDFEDMRKFFKYYNQIIEVVVDYGAGIDIISRENFLKRDVATMEKFAPHPSCTKRGMM